MFNSTRPFQLSTEFHEIIIAKPVPAEGLGLTNFKQNLIRLPSQVSHAEHDDSHPHPYPEPDPYRDAHFYPHLQPGSHPDPYFNPHSHSNLNPYSDPEGYGYIHILIWIPTCSHSDPIPTDPHPDPHLDSTLDINSDPVAHLGILTLILFRFLILILFRFLILIVMIDGMGHHVIISTVFQLPKGDSRQKCSDEPCGKERDDAHPRARKESEEEPSFSFDINHYLTVALHGVSFEGKERGCGATSVLPLDLEAYNMVLVLQLVPESQAYHVFTPKHVKISTTSIFHLRGHGHLNPKQRHDPRHFSYIHRKSNELMIANMIVQSSTGRPERFEGSCLNRQYKNLLASLVTVNGLPKNNSATASRSSPDNVLADTLSRLPLSKEPKRSEEEIQGEARRNQLLHLRTEGIPVSKKALKEETTRDKILERIQRFVRDGWPAKKDLQEEFLPYFEKREELSIEEGCILWNGRIVMPSTLQDQMLNALHEGHPGEAAMKSIATLQVWWPKINQKIESFVKNCEGCQKTRPTGPAESPVYFWNTPLEKWSRLHVDYAGPFEGKYWFILVDATSKWLEVIPVNHPSTAKTISVMREIFTRFGVPKSIVSDNGPQFTSHEFEKFCRNNNILHIKSTPYHPRTNGLAERAVRTFKERMKASRNDRGDVELKVQKFLISYRNAIHSTTGRSPASMLLGRQIRTRLDLLRPDVTANIESAQHRQSRIQHRPVRDFEEGERVWVKTDRDKEPVAGQISERRGLLSYLVEINGKIERRHADQLRKRKGGDM
ncbi:unnamed protein product [Nesidiocoris tenuis]|uniref:RNA-directed DNA polymerase n=1 Tax=Nesidiocoris tenuis TaxID=355587 RepID=A0A6H5GK22_9HEMI|nr:unnamed protein product [Nesidiocoris tenuis]